MKGWRVVERGGRGYADLYIGNVVVDRRAATDWPHAPVLQVTAEQIALHTVRHEEDCRYTLHRPLCSLSFAGTQSLSLSCISKCMVPRY